MHESDHHRSKPGRPLRAGPGSGSFTDALMRWAADGQVDERAAARSREWSMMRQANAETTFAGVLLDLAESGADVVVTTTAGRRHRGRIALATMSLCVVETDGGRDVLLRPRAITNVRSPRNGRADALGDREAPTKPGLREALELALDDRRGLMARGPGAEQGIGGELVSVGIDVVTIALSDSGEIAYLPLETIDEVVLT